MSLTKEHETIPLTVSFEDPEIDITKLVRTVKPEWENEELELKKLSGGFSCIMYKCGPKTNNPNDDALTIRARGNTLKDFPHVRLNRDFELTVLKTLSQKGLFPKIQAVFLNGYCYEYIKGKPVLSFETPPFVPTLEHLRKMASKLAEIHSTKVEVKDPSFNSGTKMFDFLEMMIEKNYADLETTLKDPHFLMKEVREIRKKVETLGLRKVLAHGDPHAGNIVINEKGNYIYVDYELTNIGYQASDFGELFVGINEMGMRDVMPDNWERVYVRAYLEKWSEIQNQSTGENHEVSEKDIDEFLVPVRIYELFFALFIGIIFECQKSIVAELEEMKKTLEAKEDMPKGFEPSQMATKLYASYFARRDEILGLPTS